MDNTAAEGGESVRFRGGMIGADGMSVVPAFPFPHAELLATPATLQLHASKWVIGRAMHVVISRGDVTTVFAEPRAFGFYLVQFRAADPHSPSPAFLTRTPEAVLAALARLGWPAEPRPRFGKPRA